MHSQFSSSRHAISEYIEIFYKLQLTRAHLNCQSPVAFTQRLHLNLIAA